MKYDFADRQTDERTGYPSIDRPWLQYYTEKDLKNTAPKCTVFDTIYRNNVDYPKDIALIYYGRKITYSKLFEKVTEAENAFLRAGVKEGDNVAFLVLSCPEMVYALLALNKIGACANMINPTFTAEQMRDRINDTEADIILILDQLYERLLPVISEICLKKKIIIPIENSMPSYVKLLVHRKLKKEIPLGKGTILWNVYLKYGKKNTATNTFSCKEGMPAVMVYSSGTTGASKGIVLVNEGINGTIAHYDKEEFEVKRHDTFLHMGAPWLSTLMVLCMLMPLKNGIAVIIEPVFSEETFFKGMKKYKPVYTLSTISHWLYVMNHEQASKIDFSRLRFPVTGGEKVLPQTQNKLNSYLKRQGCKTDLLIGYGMCELGSTAISTSMQYSKTGSLGFPITGVIASIFDLETNEEKKYGERGEIRVLTPNRMKEYYKRPDATAEFFWEDNQGQVWGCTGDVGYADEDGFFYIEGRASDTFLAKSGKKYFCFDIENVILEHPAVYQCEVIGIDDGSGYEIPFAFIVLSNDCNSEEAKIIDMIIQNCREKLEEECIPSDIRILDRFPIKPSGKRDMEALAQMVVSN